LVEEAEDDFLGVGGEEREVGPRAVPGRPERERPAGQDRLPALLDLAHRSTAPASAGRRTTSPSASAPSAPVPPSPCVARTTSRAVQGTHCSRSAKLQTTSS